MFSIIIPARIYTKGLELTLTKIQDQTYKNFEVIVIMDFEENIDKNFDKTTFIFSGIKSPGEKRNLGIKRALGEFIAFLDDDAYPDSNWLENANNLLTSNQEYIGVCGPSLTPKESDILEEIGGYIYESFLNSGPTRFRHMPKSPRIVDDYPTVNLIIRKNCLEEIGGFDISYWPGEDTKLCLDLTKKYGKRIYYSPNLIVYHTRRGVFHPHLIQLSRYAFHRGFFAKMFPQTSLRVSYFIPTFFLIYILLSPFVYVFYSQLFRIYLLPLGFYFFLMIVEGLILYNKTFSIAKSILTLLGIFLSNLTYGAFFIKGIFSKPNLVLREVDIVNDRYIKG